MLCDSTRVDQCIIVIMEIGDKVRAGLNFSHFDKYIISFDFMFIVILKINTLGHWGAMETSLKLEPAKFNWLSTSLLHLYAPMIIF